MTTRTVVRSMALMLAALLATFGVADSRYAGQPSVHAKDRKASSTSKPQVVAAYGRLPLRFEANQGQSDRRVQFLARGNGYSLFLTATESVLALRGPAPAAVLRMRLLGANPTPPTTGLEELPGKTNYFIGSDPKQWRRNVPSYGKVRFAGVYPGVDLVYYGNQGQLEYDFVVTPGADPSAIRLGFSGADRLEIDERGELVLQTTAGEVRWHKPLVYQMVGGIRQIVDGHYLREGKEAVGFAVASYDRRLPLIVDPALVYSTYLGGSGDEEGGGIAVDSSGNAYVTGYTASANFPIANASQGSFGGGGFDVFVAKLNAAGNALVYSTYLGGSADDGTDSDNPSIAVDASDNAYVTGYTDSIDFPTLNAFQPANGGFRDAFVTKLDPAGALAYSTYLGGTAPEKSYVVAVDASGNAYVTGKTNSYDFPTLNAFQPAKSGADDAFVTKLNATGALAYSTYLGGNLGSPGISAVSAGAGIAVDSLGNAYVAGATVATDFPSTPGAFQTIHGGGGFDGFVTKLNTNASGLASMVYSTFLGTSSSDVARAIAVDSSGNAYVAGDTDATNFPTTAGAFQTTFCTFRNAFVTMLNTAGSGLVYSTYLCGSGIDQPFGIAVDSSGSAYVTGQTTSSNFPTVGAFQTAGAGSFDAFVTKLNATGSALEYSSYLGGSGGEYGTAIAVDSLGNAYVTGTTRSSNFPTAGPFQAARFGTSDLFVAKIGPIDLSIAKSHAGNFTVGTNATFTLTVTNVATNPTIGTITVSDTLPTGLGFVSGNGPGWSCSAVGQVVTCTNAGPLAVGANSSIALTVSVGLAAAPHVTNTASVSTVGDANAANDSSSDSVTVDVIDLSMGKTHTGTFRVGTSGGYTLSVTNVGTTATTGAITVSDTLPAGLGFVSGTGTGWNCSAVGQVVTCTHAGPLAVGATSNITLTVSVGAAAMPSVTNTASVSTSGDPNPANDSSSDITAVDPPAADLRVTKVGSPNPVTGGGTITYTIGVTNGGPSAATGVTLTDVLMDTFVSASSTQGSCTTAKAKGKTTLNCAIGTLNDGASTTVTLVVSAPKKKGTTSNTASVTANESDPNAANNSATATVTVQ